MTLMQKDRIVYAQGDSIVRERGIIRLASGLKIADPATEFSF